MRIEIELEDDGRWIAEVKDLPGVMGYGQSREEANFQSRSFGSSCDSRSFRTWRIYSRVK